MKNRVYISGKMTGLPRTEYMRRFLRAEEALRAEGYRTMNPTRFIFSRWPLLHRLLGYKLCLLIDLWMLSKCQYIYLIGSDWRESRGARIEQHWARQMDVCRLTDSVKAMIDAVVFGTGTEAPQPAASDAAAEAPDCKLKRKRKRKRRKQS